MMPHQHFTRGDEVVYYSYQIIFETLKYSHVVLVVEIHLFVYQQSIDDIHREN